MLGIGGTELVLILIFGFLLFGPEKAPKMARTIGRVIKQFRQASDEANRKIREEVVDPFQEAIDPYKKEVEDIIDPLKDELAPLKDEFAPMKEDLDAITSGLNETKEAIANPMKTAGNKVKEAFDFDDLDEEKPASKGRKLQPSPRAKKVTDDVADPFADDAATAPKADSIESLYGLDSSEGGDE